MIYEFTFQREKCLQGDLKGQKTHPQVEHFLWCLQNIDKQTEQTKPISMVFLWQKHLKESQTSDMNKENREETQIEYALKDAFEKHM